MATISKFYLLDAATPNTGTMPGAGDAFANAVAFGVGDVTGDATGARTARDATDVKGTSNPDLESVFTSIANTSAQSWGHRRFVSRPLAAHTFAVGDGNWTFSCARYESNTNHNQKIGVYISFWRPTTGARVGTTSDVKVIAEGTSANVTTETAVSIPGTWPTAGTSIIDGDIAVFEVFSFFTQGMATAYTDSFAYNGTTEASTTSCASFVTPPAALTLFTGGTTYTKAGHGVEHG
jgi:hypothetical protein